MTEKMRSSSSLHSRRGRSQIPNYSSKNQYNAAGHCGGPLLNLVIRLKPRIPNLGQ
jgi:hypothetical protein